MSTITASAANAKNLFSNFRCIKMRNTNEDLTVAISNAIATVSGPR